MGYLSRFAGIAVVALALLTTASAGVNTPQSGWYSGNPLLGPNALRDLACAGNTCYAAGDFGTLLKSTDGGATWKGIVTGLTIDLHRVRLAGGQADQVVVGGGCSVRRSNDGGETFFRLPFTTRDTGCNDAVASFSFPTQNTGYFLLASGRTLVTTDGGRTFTRRTPVPNASQGYDILCTAERTCLAVGLASGILRTQDGGVSWTRVAFTGHITAFAQADAQTIYAAGVSRDVVKSVDGGATWAPKTFLPVSGNGRVACGDATHCLFATGGTQVVRTIDGGNSYTTIVPSGDPTLAVGFAGQSRVIAAGLSGSAEVSNDSGATWEAVGTRLAGTYRVLATGSASVAYAGGSAGALARTRDGGQTWADLSPPTDAAVTGIAASGDERLYVLGSDGTLQRSDNGGGSYRLLNTGGVRPLAIAALSPDRLLLVGQRGLAGSQNGGESFGTVGGRATRRAHLAAADLASGAVFAYGSRFAVVSTDQATTWRRIGLPKKRSILDLDFATARIGYALDSRRALWKTTDGGRRWRQLLGLGTNGGTAIAFSGPRTGYVTTRVFGRLDGSGLVLRTTDGGQSWHPQLVSPMRLTAIQSSGSTDYALAGNSLLYATGVGGDVGDPRTLTIKAKPRVRRGPVSVLVTGRLNPAVGREEVVVSRFAGGYWSRRFVTVAANGTFGTRWTLGRKAVFVAQVVGDADHVGAGTKPLSVEVR
jgi:photosystem II stability/assembly factor-like uncharacterized protein